MKAKTVGIGATLAGLISSALMAYFTPHVLLWIGIVIGLDIGATLMSWAYTQVRKMLKFPNKALWKLDDNRVWIMRRAVFSGITFSIINGVVFAFFTAPLAGWQQYAAVAVLWIMNALLVGFSAPFTWVWTFKHLLPALNRKVDGYGVRVDRDDAGKVVGIKDGNDDTMLVGRKGNHEMAEGCVEVGADGAGDAAGPPAAPEPPAGR